LLRLEHKFLYVFVPQRFDEVVNMKDMMDPYFYSVIKVAQQDGHRSARGNYFAASGIPTNQAKILVLYFWLVKRLP